jgi:hypothetical protein
MKLALSGFGGIAPKQKRGEKTTTILLFLPYSCVLDRKLG